MGGIHVVTAESAPDFRSGERRQRETSHEVRRASKRVERALQSDDAFAALQDLTKALIQRGLSQLQLYELFSWYQQRLSPEDPVYDAVVDNMDFIYAGPWARGRGFFESELRVPASTPAMSPPWVQIVGGAVELEAELTREIGPEHELWHRDAVALARRQDRDDVLFGLRQSPRVAEVHLTWSGPREGSGFPATRVFASMLDWFDKIAADSDSAQ